MLPPVVLTIDLGTSTTKVGVWDGGALVAMGRAPIATFHPGPDRAEQDAATWWSSVVDAAAAARAESATLWASIGAIGFATARQTFVPMTADGEPIGPAIVWSDRRGGSEDVAARLRWLDAKEPARLRAATWVLGPRDLAVWRLTGVVATDITCASRTGLYTVDGMLRPDALPRLVGPHLLPPVLPSATVAGTVTKRAAEELGVTAGIPVVIGAGDRQCEVLGSGGPMVSWGTTANVSIPVPSTHDDQPEGIVLSAAALGGRLLEGGVSAAGSLLEWLSSITGRTPVRLADAAASSPPGAGGVNAVPWLGGARAPWWKDGVGAGFVGLTASTTTADMARAAIEAVAWDIRRCLDRMGPMPDTLTLAGGGASMQAWVDTITGVTGAAGVRRQSAEAASVGALLIVSAALGGDLDVDTVNPVADVVAPTLAADYAALRAQADRVADALIRSADQ